MHTPRKRSRIEGRVGRGRTSSPGEVIARCERVEKYAEAWEKKKWAREGDTRRANVAVLGSRDLRPMLLDTARRIISASRCGCATVALP
jgi:hypothetical protein